MPRCQGECVCNHSSSLLLTAFSQGLEAKETFALSYNNHHVLSIARHFGENPKDRRSACGKPEAISSPQPRQRNTAMPTRRHCGRKLTATVGEIRRRTRDSCLQSHIELFRRVDAVAAFAVPPGFLSFFCGLFLSFARKKEKPPSWLNLAFPSADDCFAAAQAFPVSLSDCRLSTEYVYKKLPHQLARQFLV